MTTPYHPQENGQVEVKNKVLEGILTKTIQQHHKYWADHIPEELWAYQTTWRNTTDLLPMNLFMGSMWSSPLNLKSRL
jgi:hypothetical protein